MNGMSAAWVSVEDGDNDQNLFLAYLIAALNQADPQLGTEDLEILTKSSNIRSKVVITALLNKIAACQTPLVLIIDDYHFISNPDIHQALSYLIGHAPDNFYIALSGRSVPLVRSKVRTLGEVLELGPADLRMTFEEVRSFVRGVTQSEPLAKNIAALQEASEGWIMALQLVTIGLRSNRDMRTILNHLTGGTQVLTNYLREEIFGELDQQTQEFLLKTSILTRFCAGLCEAVTGVSNAGASIEAIEGKGLFIFSLGEKGRWFRYHALFANFLQEQLRRTNDVEVQKLHKQASAWLASNGLWSEAVTHAMQSGDENYALDLFEQGSMELIQTGNFLALLGWLKKFPDDIRIRRPRLRLTEAWAFAITGRCTELASLVDDLRLGVAGERLLAEDDFANDLALIQIVAAAQADDSACALQLAGNMKSNWSSMRPWLRDTLINSLSWAYVHSGKRADARALPVCELPFQRVYQKIITGRSWAWDGQFAEAEHEWSDALDIAEGEFGAFSVPSLLAVCSLAQLHYERGNFGEFEARLANRLDVVDEVAPTETIYSCYCALAWAHASRGDYTAARLLLDHLRAIASDRQRQRLEAAATMELVRLAWCEGSSTVQSHVINLDSSMTASDTASVSTEVIAHDIRELLAAFHQATVAPNEQSIRRLDEVVTQAESRTPYRIALEARIFLILALALAGERERAKNMLAKTLVRCERVGVFRTLLDSGEEIHKLIEELSSSPGTVKALPSQAYLARLTEAYRSPRSRGMSTKQIEIATPIIRTSLNDRERQILALAGKGLSNKQIAKMLKIGPETVKWYLKTLFGKLDVTNRIQAVNKARQMALIS